MNKSEVVEAVAGGSGLSRTQAEQAVNAFIDTVIGSAKSGEKVSILGFGTFTPTSRAARTGRNPQTGAPVKIAASKSVRFAPGSAFKTALNAKGGTKKAGGAKKAAKSTKTSSKSTKKK